MASSLRFPEFTTWFEARHLFFSQNSFFPLEDRFMITSGEMLKLSLAHFAGGNFSSHWDRSQGMMGERTCIKLNPARDCGMFSTFD